ncbi:cellulose synthase subunit BcsC-related outer membrane protein [Anaeromyxobacter paludicola]|uniref:Cellulose synthase n=1 Tax=Anaeromyxobacter paludicola TaxID=2918171 RepID=A0ABN6N5C1_9BACT|nr:cellulose synthase subunit BcsC-related outer membrane protein [Anaeromyxobacter paludicola]BDG08351.1 cellulose synthase [Anaeromyxobacter paludicola]
MAAADPAEVRGLVRNAWYWQSRARGEEAEQAWRAVLAADPDQPDALAAVGGLDARAGRAAQAREALAHLARVAPRHPELPALRREVELGPRLPPLLAAARRLAHRGRLDEGVARYRALFGEAGPPADLALEYYDTVAGTPGGWEEARAGLERLAARVPGEARVRLALARILTYREPSRREGIGQLAALSRDPTVAKEAGRAWREALLWLGASAADAPLLREYLRRHPRDAEVARALERARRAGVAAEGFAALDKGDLATATRLFSEVGDTPEGRRGLALVRARERSLQRREGFAALDRGDAGTARRIFGRTPEDPESRLGLAILAQREAAAAQRQGDLDRARAALERSRALAPRRPDLWEDGLRSVAFWSLLEEAGRARERGDAPLARRTLLSARDRAPPRERWNAELALGDLDLAAGDRAAARERYERVLREQPRQPGALRGLTASLVQERRFEEAIRSNEALLAVAPERAFRPGWLRAEAGRQRAARRRAERDLAGAEAELEAARRDDPSDAWVLHDLAAALLDGGDSRGAEPVVGALLRAAPGLPEARVLEARLLAAQGESARALDVLSALPASRTDPGLVRLRHDLEVRVRVPALVARARRGGRPEAIAELLELEREVAEEPRLAAPIARAWSDLGERRRGIGVLRRAVEASPPNAPSLRLQLAALLVEIGEDAEAGPLLEGLAGEPGLGRDERRWLRDLRVSRAVRLSDRRRETGDPAGAAAALAPVLHDYPEDPRVLDARGRNLAPGDPDRAREAFERALALDPGDAEARRGAVDAALATGDRRAARDLAEDGVRRAPGDARLQLLAGRAAAAEGDDPAAMDALLRARALADALPPRVAGRAAADVPIGPGRTRLPPGPERPPPEPLDPEAAAATRQQIDREEELVRARHRSGLEGMGRIRARQGEGGLGALTEADEIATAELALGHRGFAFLRATGVELEAGSVANDATTRFGRGAGASGTLRAYGVAPSLGYEGRAISAEVGATPLGFPAQTVVGSLELRHAFGPVRIAVAGARRPVTDSLLSYAGIRDLVTGRTWGGVVTEGGRLELGLELGPVRAYGYGAYDRLVGSEVRENRRAMAGAGVRVTLAQGPLGALSVGVEGTGMRFDDDLRFFTLGHGGYFSPQRFLRGTLPVGWRRDQGAVRWELVAAPGAEWFEERETPVFPAVPGLAPPTGVDTSATYRGQQVSGFVFEARAGLGARFGGGFEVRATAAFQQAPEYQEGVGGLLLRYGGSR